FLGQVTYSSSPLSSPEEKGEGEGLALDTHHRKRRRIMKHTLATVISVVSFATLLGLGMSSRAQADCMNASLKGTYAFSCTGTASGVPVAAVGIVTFDGKGQAAGTYTVSANGAVTPDVSVTGTYTVNADCTASTAFSDGSHYDLALFKGGFYSIETDAGTVVTCRKEKQ